MTETLPRLDEPGDAELISAVRGGDVSSYGPLFERHVGAARRLARQLVGAADADDLVSDAFAKVLRVLQGGGGPDVAFRAYLLTAVRRLHVDKMRAGAKLHTTDNLEAFDPGVPFRDTAVEGFESAAAAKAFASLPERWQAVLWHTEVEGQKPAEVAVLLGMSPNSVSALAYRAREGLRQAFLSSHISELDESCAWTHEHLGAYIRNGVSKRDAAKVEKHLDDCRKCMAIYLELTEVNSNLAGILAPLLLGGAGAGYLASSTLAAKGGVLLFLDRAKDAIASNGQVAAVAGVAASAAVVGGLAIAATSGDEPRNAPERPAAVAPLTTEPAPARTPSSSPSAPPVSSPVPTRSQAPVIDVPTEEPSTDEPVTSEPTTDPPVVTVPPVVTEPPTTTPPTTPPTTTPPTTPPPPTYDLALAPIEVADTSGLGKVTLVATTSGYPPGGGTAAIEITYPVVTFNQIEVPDTCSPIVNGHSCPVSAAAPSVTIELTRPLLATRLVFTATDMSFADSSDANNTQQWVGTVLDGLVAPGGLLGPHGLLGELLGPDGLLGRG